MIEAEVLTDCAQLRIDPDRLTLWQYQAILTTHNRRIDPEAKPERSGDFTDLRRAIAAHQSAAVH